MYGNYLTTVIGYIADVVRSRCGASISHNMMAYRIYHPTNFTMHWDCKVLESAR